MARVVINGETHELSERQTLLEALRSLGISLPTLCHDDRLRPSEGCRLCLVHIRGRSRPSTACGTFPEDGMVIETHTQALEDYRRTILSLLAEAHPQSLMDADSNKEFHRALRNYGIRGHEGPAPETDLSHPYIAVSMSQCIDCLRCVRICAEVQGQFTWTLAGRGEATQIVPDRGSNLSESSCVSCGACVDTCPTSALQDKTVLERGGAERWTRTTCLYCGVGCEMEVGTRGEQIVQIRPVLDAPSSKGHLCVKGRYAYDFVRAPDRITTPMIRENGILKQVSWDDAIAFAARGLRRIRDAQGPDAIGILGSARATNEENYLAQKFARTVIGTNNVDCCARVCHTPSAAALKWMLGTGAATNSFDDIEAAQAFVLCGTNATENHPVVGARIKQRVLAGVPLIVIDPRKTELATLATVHLALRPGTNIPLLNAISQVIVSENLFDADFLTSRTEEVEWEKFKSFIAAFTPESVAEICGVDAGDIRRAARLYAGAKTAMSFHGLGVTEHVQGTEGVMALVNLALLTGNLGRRGAGINPLRGQNNVQGAAHMGCDPGILTGSVSLADGRPAFEAVWKSKLPEKKGLNLLEMMDAALDGSLKSLWVMGYDVLLTNPNVNETRRAMAALELVIVQDLFLTETAREFAHVFLPVVSGFEKEGTFMNSERRIQKIRPALAPLQGTKTDAEIIQLMAHALDGKNGFSFRSAEEIWDEIRTVWPQAAGITYERLEPRGLQWPCPNTNHPGTSILHEDIFASGKKAALKRIDFQPTPETCNRDYPFLLTTGRSLFHFNAGTMTLRTPNRILRPTDFVEIHPEDASRLSLHDGDRARMHSRYGEAAVTIHVSDSVKPGELFSTFHTAEVFLNHVIGPYRDRYVKAPEYKVTAVTLEKIIDSPP